MALWVFAFSPDPVAAATIPGVVAGLALIEGVGSFRRAALYVALFGAAAIGFGYRWLVPTVEAFGGLSRPAAIGVLILFGVAGTVHAIVFAGLYRVLFARGVRPHPMATAALVVACELLPIRFFPWTTGHGVVDVAPLRQLAEWGGVALVSFATLCFVVPLHELLRWSFASKGPPARPHAAAATLLVAVVLYGAGYLRYRAVSAAEDEAGRHVRVAIVQANVGSLDKRQAEQRGGDAARRSQEAYRRLTFEAAERGADLVVWPETALMGAGDQTSVRLYDPVPGRFRLPSAIREDLRRLGYGYLEEVGADRTLLLGGYEDETGPPNLAGARARLRFNAAMLREPGGEAWSLYRKVKLIPFGETMPLSGVFPMLDDRLPQRFRMNAGERGQPPLEARRLGLTIVPFICYEAILSDFVRELAEGHDPDLLVNLTNDSWYGDTWEPRQHLNFSRFRSVEHRRPMVRATNTGISAFVDAAGDVVARLGYSKEGVLVHDVPVWDRPVSLYAKTGGWVPWIFWLWGFVILVWSLVRPSPHER
jgi:apolipoprotein N-acyltransferase